MKKILLTVLTFALLGSVALAQKPVKKSLVKKPMPPKNETKAQGQMAGLNGQFGTIYTLKDGFNFSVRSAKYTIEPMRCYGGLYAEREEKLLLMSVAVKNANPGDTWFPGEEFTLVDSDNQTYPVNTYNLQSQPGKEFSITLRPGQGIGQGEDPVLVGARLPAKVRIVKIILNKGRKGRAEDVIRYYVAGATKAEAGEDGDPKNIVAGFPAECVAPGDKSGAVLLSPTPAKMGQPMPSGSFTLRLDNVAYSTTEICNNNPPEEGKQYAIVTVTVKYLGVGEESFFGVGGDYSQCRLIDGDGENATIVAVRKTKRDEEPQQSFKFGDEYTCRIFFTLPKDAKGKTLVLGTAKGNLLTYSLTP